MTSTRSENVRHNLSGRQKWLAVMLALIGLGGTGAFMTTHNNVQASSISNSENSTENGNQMQDDSQDTSTSQNYTPATTTRTDNTSINSINNSQNNTENNNTTSINQTRASNNYTDNQGRLYYDVNNNSSNVDQGQPSQGPTYQQYHQNVLQSSKPNLTVPKNNGYYGPAQHTIFLKGTTGDKSAQQIGDGQLGTDHSKYYDYGYAIGQAEEGVTVSGKPIWTNYHPSSNMLYYWYHNEPGSIGGNSAPVKKKSGTWYFWVEPGAMTNANKNGAGPSQQSSDSAPTGGGTSTPTSGGGNNSQQTPSSGGSGNGSGNGDSPNNSVTTPSGPSTGNGTQGGGNGTQGGNGDSPNNGNPNNSDPNNSNPNNSNPNNANIVVPNGPNNNNVFPAGGSTSNNNLIPNGPIFNNTGTGNINDQAIIGALVNNEDRNEQDAINRLDTNEHQAESEASTQSAQQVVQSLSNVSAAEKGKDALQVASMQESARMQSLTNSMASNNAQQAIRSSAASSKADYMNRINSDHANVNSAAQNVLDEMSSLTNLTSNQKVSAIKALQNEESSFMSAANTTNSSNDAELNTNMNANIHHLEVSLRNDEDTDQASQASSAMSGVNSYATDFSGFMMSFKGLTSEQSSQLNNDMNSDVNMANSGIKTNEANNSILNSLVNSVASDVISLEAQGKSTSTSNSNMAASLAASSASSADNSLHAHTDAEVNSVENNNGFSPDEKSAIVAALESAEASDEARINAKIIAGRGKFINGSAAKSANGNDNNTEFQDKSILKDPTAGLNSSNNQNNSHMVNSSKSSYNPYGYNGTKQVYSTSSSNQETRPFQQGYSDAKAGRLDENAMDKSPEYRKGYNAYMNGYHDGLKGTPSLKSFYSGLGQKPLRNYMNAYTIGSNHMSSSVTTSTGTDEDIKQTVPQTGTINMNSDQTSYSNDVPTSTVHTSVTQQNNTNKQHQKGTLPQTGEQNNQAAEAGAGAGLAGLGAAVITDFDKRRRDKNRRHAHK